MQLLERLREVIQTKLPVPGTGQTALRHQRLLQFGCEDLSLARLLEAHFDATAILAEAGRDPEPGVIYGVWASERAGAPLRLRRDSTIDGSKMFCSGAGIVGRALVTVSEPEPRLFDVDLRTQADRITIDESGWYTQAFGETKTATVTFRSVAVQPENQVGPCNWYLDRPGFWHGACGPAACWAGGAVRLVEWAVRQSRRDSHTLAHLAAMHSASWALTTCLQQSGDEIDRTPDDILAARLRARTVRHLVEQMSTDILRRLARAYGPYPLAMNEEIGRHYQELDIYLRQWHGERDLEALGADVLALHAAV